MTYAGTAIESMYDGFGFLDDRTGRLLVWTDVDTFEFGGLCISLFVPVAFVLVSASDC